MAREFLTRRNLLLGLGLAGAGAAVSAAPFRMSWSPAGSKRTGSWWDRTFVSLRHGGIHDWSSVVGESFMVAGAGAPAMLKLVAVNAMPAKGRRPSGLGRDQAFAAVFEAVGQSAPSGDRICTITHRSQAAFDIFFGKPLASGSKTQLIAIFN
jgi:hypothetical protein